MSSTVFITLPRRIAFNTGRMLIQWARRPIISHAPPDPHKELRRQSREALIERERDRNLELYILHARQFR